VLEHECDCKHQFGSFVQGYDAKTPCNTASERAVDSICLGATADDAQGGNELLNLNAKRHCTQGQVIFAPAPDGMIKKAEALTTKDGIQSLKFIAHLIAGVNSLLQQKQDQEDQDDNKDQDYEHSPEDDEDLDCHSFQLLPLHPLLLQLVVSLGLV